MYTYAGVGPIHTATTSEPMELQAFYHAVLSLTAAGGGDFAEYALDGMREGLLVRRTAQNSDFMSGKIPTYK